MLTPCVPFRAWLHVELREDRAGHAHDYHLPPARRGIVSRGNVACHVKINVANITVGTDAGTRAIATNDNTKYVHNTNARCAASLNLRSAIIDALSS